MNGRGERTFSTFTPSDGALQIRYEWIYLLQTFVKGSYREEYHRKDGRNIGKTYVVVACQISKTETSRNDDLSGPSARTSLTREKEVHKMIKVG
jgi:hypothetical protein